MTLDFFVILNCIFLFAGAVKGVVGFGFPSISIGLLCIFVNWEQALVFFVIPALITNIWQSVVPNSPFLLIKKFHLLFLSNFCAIFIGIFLFQFFSVWLVELFLGLALLLYSIQAGIGKIWMAKMSTHSPMVPMGVGGSNGIIAGLTGCFVFPGLAYLKSLGLDRGVLVQCLGILFTSSSLALLFGLFLSDRYPIYQGILSVLGVPASLAGMYIGAKIRDRISQSCFEVLALLGVGIMGIVIILAARSHW